LIEGGYKAFRQAMLKDLQQKVLDLSWHVVCGTTGSGKTRLLQALAQAGAQVVDLEALAHHRSSVLGLIPGQEQPTQKAFDTRVWTALQAFDTARPVYIESESKKVGNVVVPDSLMAAMRRSPCLHLQLSQEERVKLLLEDYDFFVRDIEFFCNRLGALAEARGKAVVADWQARSRAGGVAGVVKDLLVLHYDPVYLQSMQRNFTHYAAARPLAPSDHSVAAMQALAATLAGT
jgi:tRNA 2-selenouridine synthase